MKQQKYNKDQLQNNIAQELTPKIETEKEIVL